MYDIQLHDYAHCDHSECSKKDTCFRYWLFEQDKILKETKNIDSFCYYIQIDEQQVQNCTVYLPKNQI